LSGDSTFVMLLRLGFSLAFVLGLIWCAAWVARRRSGQGAAGLMKLGRRDSQPKAPGIEVLERRSVGRHGSVAVLRVGSQCLLVGITEQQVQLLGEVTTEATPDDDRDDGVDGVDGVDHRIIERTALTIPGDDDVDLTDSIPTSATPVDVGTIQMAARRTGPHGTTGSRSPRMNLVDAMRELTVRRT
jgi:flagellar biosynthetic protein FliO